MSQLFFFFSEPDKITTFIFLCSREHEPTAEFNSLPVYYNYRSWESLLDVTHICVSCPYQAADMCIGTDSVCLHAYAAEHLAGPLANIRPGGGPSALEASCIPQPQQLTTHLSAFMRVSSNSRPAAHLLKPPLIRAHRTRRLRRGMERGGGVARRKLAEED